MELRNICTFLEVAEQGAFSKAAKRLGYSQSSVTVQVQQLERELGVRLFDRLPRGVSLTEQGRAFAFHATEVIGAVDTARASVANTQPDNLEALHGTLRIGSVESVATMLMPELLDRYHRLCPHVQTVLKTAHAEDIYENRVDVLLSVERPLDLQGIACEALRSEDVVFVAAPKFVEREVAAGAALLEGPLSAQDLAALPFILTERGESYRLELDRLLSERGEHIEPVVELSNTETLIRLVERGVGATFVPRFVAADGLASGRLVELASELPAVRLSIQLLRHRQKWMAPHMEAFIGIARELCRV